jgi:hypothetical protein
MAIQYFKIAGKVGKFVMVEENNGHATIFLKADLLTQKADLIARIGTTDTSVPTTNAEWIAWAKANYPYVSHAAEQAELDRITAIIEAIKDL